MEPGKIRFWRRFLFRSFLTGCLFYLFSLLVIFLFRNTWLSLLQDVFHMDAATSWKVIMIFLVGAKLILVFLMLVPALALHWEKTESPQPGK